MRKKWRNIRELCETIVEQDSFLDDCGGKLKLICHAPNIGYRCWIFKYKGTLVSLFDEGNGYYGFYSTVTYLDVIEALIVGMIDYIRYSRGVK